MRVLLAGPDFEENLSLRYLASALVAAGHEALLVPFNDAEDITRVVLLARDFDLIGLSLTFQVRAREFLSLAAALKADRPTPIVVGGHFASCAADDLLLACGAMDVIVLHEGEASLCAIADRDGDPARLADVRLLHIRSCGPRIFERCRPPRRGVTAAA